MKALPSRSSALRIAAIGSAFCAVGATVPAGAGAAGCQGAPGTSALEQYCEAIPDASGGREQPGSSKSGGASSSGSESSASDRRAGVSSSTSQALGSAGADGAAVARLAGGASGSDPAGSKSSGTKGDDSKDSGGPTGKATGRTQAKNGNEAKTGSSEEVKAPANPSNSPLKATSNAVAGGPTVGGGLVWGLLGMSAIGAVAAVFLRRHGRVEPLDADES